MSSFIESVKVRRVVLWFLITCIIVLLLIEAVTAVQLLRQYNDKIVQDKVQLTLDPWVEAVKSQKCVVETFRFDSSVSPTEPVNTIYRCDGLLYVGPYVELSPF